jgi:hypothetical protein
MLHATPPPMRFAPRNALRVNALRPNATREVHLVEHCPLLYTNNYLYPCCAALGCLGPT